MTAETEYPYALDIAAVFVAVQLGPVAPYAVAGAVALAVARRSGLFLGLALDLIAQITGTAYVPDTPTVRGLLPGLERLPKTKQRSALPAPEQADRPGFIGLDTLAAARNVLIVGSPGSGKTTLLKALLMRRRHPVFVFDPHAAPDDWPMAALVIGAGRDFGAIYRQLVNAEKRMDSRSKQRANGLATFQALSLAGDEWGSICSEILTRKDEDAPGRILLRLLKEGRKFGINAILSAHGDTAASVGSRGDTKAFRLSFDWIVYMGGYVGQYVGDAVRSYPMGSTPEGTTFPLLVVAVNPATNEQHLIDLRKLPGVRGLPRNHPQPDHQTPALGTSSQDVLESLLASGSQAENQDRGGGGSLVPADTNAVPVSGSQESGTSTQDEAGTTDVELVTALVQAGWSANKIYKRVGGKRTEVLDLIRQIKGQDDPDPDIGPFKTYLGGQS